MGFFNGIGRVLITLLNIVFIIVSVVFILFGIIGMIASKIPAIKDIEDSIKESLKSLSNTFNTGGDTSSIDSFTISDFVGPLAIFLIVMGCVLMFISIMGCCGACCQIKTAILIYGIIITIFLVAEILVAILLYAAPSTIQGHIKDGLMESLKQYKSFATLDATTLSWMFVMKEFECCGVDGYTDFQQTISKEWVTAGIISTDLDAPLTCCKVQPTGGTDADGACARSSPAATFNIFTKGCYEAIWDVVLGNPLWVGVGGGALLLFQILLIVFSFMYFSKLKKKNSQKVHPRY